MGIGMAEDAAPAGPEDQEPDPADLETLASQIEAALERIARNVGPAPSTAELAARLDRLILRLRDALHRVAD